MHGAEGWEERFRKPNRTRREKEIGVQKGKHYQVPKLEKTKRKKGKGGQIPKGKGLSEKKRKKKN